MLLPSFLSLIQRFLGPSLIKLPRIILITDHAHISDYQPLLASFKTPIIVLFRDYDAPEREKKAVRLAELCRRHRHLFLVANDAALAFRCKADGIHFSEWNYRRIPSLRMQHPLWIISAAVHSETSLRRLSSYSIDIALISPAFPTASHPGSRGLGPIRLSRIIHSLSKRKRSRIAFYALGGVTPNTLPRLQAIFSCHGIAGIRWRNP